MQKLGPMSCAVLVLLLTSVTGAFADDGKKAKVGLLGDEVVSHAATHFVAAGGDGDNAGAIASSEGKVKGLGKVTVDVSSSWDWGLFSSTDHPCALMNISSHTFSAVNDAIAITAGTAPCLTPIGTAETACTAAGFGFTTDATVTITTKKGDEVSGVVRGGSVCEIATFTGPICTINEGITAFEITGGTGKFVSASGSGVLRSIFNFCTGTFELDEIMLHLIKG